MSPDDFRALALALPGATEGEHMHHPDFRAHGRIFATLVERDGALGMVKLTVEQQAALVRSEPRVYEPVPGGWGLRGATHVRLAAAKAASVRKALQLAWNNVAAK